MCEVEKPKVPIFGKKYFKSVRKGSKDAEKLFLTGLENGKKKKIKDFVHCLSDQRMFFKVLFSPVWAQKVAVSI